MTRRTAPTLPRWLVLLLALTALVSGAERAHAAQDTGPTDLLARADSLELDTEYEAPPGNPLHHHTAGFAKILCSNVFIGGLDPEFAAENVGFFSAPDRWREFVVDTVVDRENEAVHLTLPNGVTRTAKRYGSQGCVALPRGADSVRFTPSRVEPELPDPATTPWRMGDVLPDEPFPEPLDSAAVAEAVDAAFRPPEGMTAAFLVTWKGRIVGERYREGIDMHTARDWARIGNLYLQDGTWQGERILPEGYTDYVTTVAPAWKADGRPYYGGGFFWLNTERSYPIPESAYYTAGAGNQKVFVIPSHDLVVVRLGHYRGGGPGDEGLERALSLLVDAVPRSR